MSDNISNEVHLKTFLFVSTDLFVGIGGGTVVGFGVDMMCLQGQPLWQERPGQPANSTMIPPQRIVESISCFPIPGRMKILFYFNFLVLVFFLKFTNCLIPVVFVLLYQHINYICISIILVCVIFLIHIIYTFVYFYYILEY